MSVRPQLPIIAGALLAGAIGLFGGAASDEEFVARLSDATDAAIAEADGAPVTARFTSGFGWPTRHPTLSGGENLDETTRDRVAKAVAILPGVGGVDWSDGTIQAQGGLVPVSPMHCQDDVNALLEARTIRFEESSSVVDAASQPLLDEVAAALKPCLGAKIAITGHTDASGSEEANLELSRARATSIRRALVRRGIPAEGLRAEGVGSSTPIDGLSPQDPANRRIEFSVIATQPLQPTPVDTPGPR